MMNKLFVLAAAVTVLQVPSAALAMSAFAAGIPSSVADQGVAVGTGYNYASRAEAENRALGECKAPGDAPESTKALCTIIAYFDNECLAVSFDPAAGTPGFGWAVGATKPIAESQALANCRATAGARSGYCEVRISDCDTHS
jgi:hypothetical protein